MKIKNSTFYKRHELELEKYLNQKKSLHISNLSSKNKINLNSIDNIFLDLEDIGNLQKLDIVKKYERIVFTDVIENHYDLNNLLTSALNLLNEDGKLIISSLNYKYSIIFKMFEFFNLKDSNKNYSYINPKKIDQVTSGIGLSYQKYYSKQIFPFKFFGLGNYLNSILESIFFYFNLGIKTYMVFKPTERSVEKFSKSVIVPAKNEAGNLEELIDRIPDFENLEIIFSYGKSDDNTLEVMKNIMKLNNKYNFKLVKQSKNGKANAVWEALDVVENDLIAILDADISVDPETLIDFFEIIENNRADFVNGTRLIYQMEKNSMRFLNKIGNRFFQFFIGKIINEQLTDSLCGTKVFKRSFISDLKLWQSEFNVTDPFGDFDLIFSAAYTGQKILELPINYRERKYGKTQISRFRDGLKLFVYLFMSFIVFNTSRNE